MRPQTTGASRWSVWRLKMWSCQFSCREPWLQRQRLRERPEPRSGLETYNTTQSVHVRRCAGLISPSCSAHRWSQQKVRWTHPVPSRRRRSWSQSPPQPCSSATCRPSTPSQQRRTPRSSSLCPWTSCLTSCGSDASMCWSYEIAVRWSMSMSWSTFLQLCSLPCRPMRFGLQLQ